MKRRARYDEHAQFYAEFIRQGLARPEGLYRRNIQMLLDLIGPVAGLRVCDLACGEGHLARVLADRGATVTGVDISAKLLEIAAATTPAQTVRYLRDDACELATLAPRSFDLVVSNMAIMDIEDEAAMFGAVHRILDRHGRLVMSMLHPCFETPFRVPDSHIATDDEGNFLAVIVRNYAEEGYWQSGGDGVRGRVGAYHRKLTTYLNGLLDSGFELERFAEPNLAPGDYPDLASQSLAKIAKFFVVAARKRQQPA